mmetsp:Transcript_31613/g.64359  ORF Transcript_31613/g.64359 Transcript_31613/m.64359 type:complete len:445 (+) Transcript_31613:503-1837(+)|eukprot:CAMPEP_0178694240 /NCGR_PEP_ID=MMETSP0699-20121125/8143_1 /TAXON_ID=265572 /ORGANISM="Extubocellulus spinifer, Strain CCMP396" /LENGTH=444 /DNA_ID=CAMNT_0020339711 /DNA_START=2574 /DNA_END=3908 /DNA_ORIENTATION=-
MEKTTPKKEEEMEKDRKKGEGESEKSRLAAWYANLTPEQKERRRERQRKRYHNMTREQKEVRNTMTKARYQRIISSSKGEDVARVNRRRGKRQEYDAKKWKAMTKAERILRNKVETARRRKVKHKAMVEKGVRKGVFSGYRRIRDGSFAGCVDAVAAKLAANDPRRRCVGKIRRYVRGRWTEYQHIVVDIESASNSELTIDNGIEMNLRLGGKLSIYPGTMREDIPKTPKRTIEIRSKQLCEKGKGEVLVPEGAEQILLELNSGDGYRMEHSVAKGKMGEEGTHYSLVMRDGLEMSVADNGFPAAKDTDSTDSADSADPDVEALSSRSLGSDLGQEDLLVAAERREKERRETLRKVFVCSICTERYNQGPTNDNDHSDRRPTVLPGSCGRSICMSCAENDRASQIEGLAGNRKMIKCMFCKAHYHSEKHIFYPNRDLMSVMAEA